MKGVRSQLFWVVAGIAILTGKAALADAPNSNSGSATTEDRPGTQAQLRTTDGLDKDQLRCSCTEALGVCLLGGKAEKVVTFVLPEGYKRLSFSEQVSPQGLRSGGRVYWESDDPHDARVHLECYADLFSSADVTVSSVLGIKE